MSEERPPLEATALLETGDAAVHVLHHNHVGMQIRIDRVVRVSNTLKLAIDHRGDAPGQVRLLTAVDRVRTADDGMTLDLRYLALHSVQGKPCLTSFLLGPLGAPTVEAASFKEGAGGWFYGFKATRPAPEPEPTEAKDRQAVRRKTGTLVVESQRRETRVVVRVPVAFKSGGKTWRGHAYNISFSGIYVLADGKLPPEGAMVQVAYPIAVHAKPFKALLEGEVVWSMPSMSTSTAGGVGIRLSRIEDGGGGAIWREYVEKEAEFGGVVQER